MDLPYFPGPVLVNCGRAKKACHRCLPLLCTTVLNSHCNRITIFFNNIMQIVVFIEVQLLAVNLCLIDVLVNVVEQSAVAAV